MGFKIKFQEFSFRNNSVDTRKNVIDSFFQTNNIEFWEIDNTHEVIFASYDDTQPNPNPTKFTVFDAGPGGIDGEIVNLNASVALSNFIKTNKILKTRMLNNKKIAVQYIVR